MRLVPVGTTRPMRPVYLEPTVQATVRLLSSVQPTVQPTLQLIRTVHPTVACGQPVPCVQPAAAALSTPHHVLALSAAGAMAGAAMEVAVGPDRPAVAQDERQPRTGPRRGGTHPSLVSNVGPLPAHPASLIAGRRQGCRPLAVERVTGGRRLHTRQEPHTRVGERVTCDHLCHLAQSGAVGADQGLYRILTARRRPLADAAAAAGDAVAALPIVQGRPRPWRRGLTSDHRATRRGRRPGSTSAASPASSGPTCQASPHPHEQQAPQSAGKPRGARWQPPPPFAQLWSPPWSARPLQPTRPGRRRRALGPQKQLHPPPPQPPRPQPWRNGARQRHRPLPSGA